MKQVKKRCRAVGASPTPGTPAPRQGPGDPARLPVQTASPIPRTASTGEPLRNELERKRQKNLESFAP